MGNPSIRLRRYASAASVPLNSTLDGIIEDDDTDITRRRSESAPQHVPEGFAEALNMEELARQRTAPSQLEPVVEERTNPNSLTVPQVIQQSQSHDGRSRGLSLSSGRRSVLARGKSMRHSREQSNAEEEYNTELVDFLDVVDPEVSALTTLTNVQNSLFVPDLGAFLNRMPTYNLSRHPTASANAVHAAPARRAPTPVNEIEGQEGPQKGDQDSVQNRTRRESITSNLDEEHYAVLPHGVSLVGWSEEDKEQLNDHVRHLLHSRRAKFMRGLKGFGQYVSKPLGFFVTLYAFLITGFGLVWVLFLIGWIYAGDARQDYDINVVDNVLVALFAVVGDGLAPFRLVDTYHMAFIAHYHRFTWKIRQRNDMATLPDPNDLPVPNEIFKKDVELGHLPRLEGSVLTPAQQARLEYHQKKFSKSHTYYKPHETNTHYAFPVSLLIAITVLLDLHSCFQIALGACTWGISYHVRPIALTPTILCFSITCNITGGVLISLGDRKTRKKEVIERLKRQNLTQEAMKKIEKSEKRKLHSQEHGSASSRGGGSHL